MDREGTCFITAKVSLALVLIWNGWTCLTFFLMIADGFPSVFSSSLPLDIAFYEQIKLYIINMIGYIINTQYSTRIRNLELYNWKTKWGWKKHQSLIIILWLNSWYCQTQRGWFTLIMALLKSINHTLLHISQNI